MTQHTHDIRGSLTPEIPSPWMMILRVLSVIGLLVLQLGAVAPAFGNTTVTNANSWSAISTNMPPMSVTNSVVHTGSIAATSLFYRVKAWR